MRRVTKVGLGILAVVVAGGGYYFSRIMPRIPERPFLKPAGPYPVGTREFDWVDSSRAETYTTNPADHRRVVVQVWYPAAAADGDTAKYLVRPQEFVSRLGAWAARKARTNSVLDAPVAVSEAPFPVIVYNHGGLWTRWSATFSTEWLASHGYVVFSVEHFGFNQTTRFPDGTVFAADTLAFPKETGDGKKDAFASWAYLDDPVFLIWKGDARFTLDRAERLNREPGPFQGRLDLERVGAYGWSFGGALAVQLTVDDPRVKAAVDHDGQLFGNVREVGTARPILQLHHGADDALDFPEKDRPAVREMMALVESWDSVARTRSRAPTTATSRIWRSSTRVKRETPTPGGLTRSSTPTPWRSSTTTSAGVQRAFSGWPRHRSPRRPSGGGAARRPTARSLPAHQAARAGFRLPQRLS